MVNRRVDSSLVDSCPRFVSTFYLHHSHVVVFLCILFISVAQTVRLFTCKSFEYARDFIPWNIVSVAVLLVCVASCACVFYALLIFSSVRFGLVLFVIRCGIVVSKSNIELFAESYLKKAIHRAVCMRVWGTKTERKNSVRTSIHCELCEENCWVMFIRNHHLDVSIDSVEL